MSGKRGKRRPAGRIERLGRPMLAAMFIQGGWAAFREPGRRPEQAAKLGLPDPERMVRMNGLGMAVAGTALALGIRPRLSALALAGLLVPTTLAGHRFWEEESAQGRAMQRTHFLKNVGLLGGLLVVVSRR